MALIPKTKLKPGTDSFQGRLEFLSNFYPATVLYNGQLYPTSEHAFQATKAVLESERERIQNATSPGTAKRLGRKCKCRPNWDLIKDQVMCEVCRDKFTRHTILRLQLIATGNEVLIEGNYWHDNYWGVCTCDDYRCNGGENKLGEILMRLRKELTLT